MCPRCGASRANAGAPAGAGERELGRLDILIPNAGISAGAPAEEMTEEAFSSVMDVNFNSVFALCQLAHPLLKRGGRGKILTIGSEYSIYGSRNTVGYSSSKHAILGLTKSLAIGWAKDRIQVNCVIPVSAPSALSAALPCR